MFLLLLLVLACCTTGAERTRMRSGLDSLNVRNRTDLPFTSADVQPYVDYFDRHGTANDRLLAHYLMGRAYHEQGEAPMALQCYQQAAECADTTASDCDYAQLSRVYGQMADIFYDQALYRQGLQCDKFSELYAWKGKDTLAALMSYEQENYAYSRLGLKDSAIFVIEDVAMKYKKYGYHKNAAICFGLILKGLLEKGEYQKAKNYMDTYESESGFFDSKGNIESGREIYYKAKGLYYLYQFQYDSAEYYFRKELQEGKDFGNQHSGARGLTLLFQRLHKPDSIAKYALYTYDMNDSLNDKKTTRDVKRIQSMYDYSRHQKIAAQKSEEASRATRNFWITISCLLFVCMITVWLYYTRKAFMMRLEETTAELAETRAEQQELLKDKSNNQQLLEANSNRIKQLEKRLGRYSRLVYFGIKNAENDLKLSPCYQTISNRFGKDPKLSEEEWEIARNLINEYFPGCHDYLTANLPIDSLKFKICILLRLHFINKEVGLMIGYTPAYSSRLSSEIYKELFGKEGGSKELAKKLCDIF